MLVAAGTIAVLNGVISTAILIVVHKAIDEGGHATAWVFGGFIALMALAPVSRVVSHLLLVNIAQSVVFDTRRHICKHILMTPLRELEKLGRGKVMASLTSDVQSIASASTLLPFMVMQVFLLVGGVCYLTWLYWQAGLALLVTMAGGYLLLKGMARRLTHYFGLARAEEDVLIKHFEGAIDGAKEYKFYRGQRSQFLEEELPKALQIFKKNTLTAQTHYSINIHIVYLLFYACLGALVFTVPYFDEGVTGIELSKYVMIMLYMWASISRLSASLNVMIPAMIAMRKVEELGARLNDLSDKAEPNTTEFSRDWKKLELSEVTHSYHREKEDETFTLGPLSISFVPGEIVFIIGGNGSGKTTLAKLITGLYTPESGTITVDGEVVNDKNRDDYRQLYATIFSDFYLFENIKGLQMEGNEELVDQYLEKLQLNHKVKVKDGQLSTTSLSQGQRKRLALLNAYLQDRAIYLFDEWAADQDPLFKGIFYRTLLPELRAAGKTVIAVTHDDHYFHLADRIIRIGNNAVEYDSPAQDVAVEAPVS